MACAPRSFLPNRVLLAVVYLLGKDTTRPPSSQVDQRDDTLQVRKLKRNTSKSSAPFSMSKPARKTILGAPNRLAQEPIARAAIGWKPKLIVSNRLCKRPRIA